MADGEPAPNDCDSLREAVGKTGEEEKGRQQYLIVRAVELGCIDVIPDDWEVEIDG